MKPRVVGLAGPSGAGKSTLARALAERLGSDSCTIFSLDGYYRDLAHLPCAERDGCNFDEPAAMDVPLIVDHLTQLTAGRPVAAPRYDFTRHLREAEPGVVAPAPWIVVEGLFVLHWAEVRALVDVPVYIQGSEELCFARRVERDMGERGREREECESRFRDHVIPSTNQFVAPSAQWARLHLDGAADITRNVEQLLLAMDPWGERTMSHGSESRTAEEGRRPHARR